MVKKAFFKCLVKFPPPGHFHLGLVVCEVLILEGLSTLLSIQDSIKLNLRQPGTSLRKNYSLQNYFGVHGTPYVRKAYKIIIAAVPAAVYADKISNFLLIFKFTNPKTSVVSQYKIINHWAKSFMIYNRVNLLDFMAMLFRMLSVGASTRERIWTKCSSGLPMSTV